MSMLPSRRRVLWKLCRAGQVVQCDVRPHRFGLELRSLVNGKPIATRIFEDRQALDSAASAWWEGLLSRGWRTADGRGSECAPVAS
jgi:hypothetical protein